MNAARRFAALFVVSLVLPALATAADRATWSITDVGALGQGGSRAVAVNNRGDVVGSSFAGLFNRSMVLATRLRYSATQLSSYSW